MPGLGVFVLFSSCSLKTLSQTVWSWLFEVNDQTLNYFQQQQKQLLILAWNLSSLRKY